MSAALAMSPDWTHIAVHSLPRRAEAEWRALEATGLCTPYQRYDWLAAWYETVGHARRLQPAIVTIHGPGDSPAALFPLVIDSNGPARVARFAGGKHCNANMGVYAADFAPRLDSTRAAALLFAMGESLPGVDAFDLRSQPVAWAGFANPLACLGGAREAEQAFALTLQAGESPDALARRLLGKDSRKKLAKKKRWLQEIGPTALHRAQTAAEAEEILEAFFRQRAARFAERGMGNPFACPATQDFLRRAALSGLGQGRPALELYALRCGDRIAATFGGCSDGRRLSGTFISFEPDPALMRSSPGELLTMELAQAALSRGLAEFDLGMGDEGYKRHVCPEQERRVDVITPVTPLGHAVAFALRGAGRVKQLVKRDDRVLRTVRRAFRLVSSF